MISAERFSRIASLDGVTADQARKTAFYYRLKDGRLNARKLQRRPLYQVMPLLKEVFASKGELPAFNNFLKWANEPFSTKDRLQGDVQKFIKYNNTVDNRRYLLGANKAIELYVNNYLNHPGDQIDSEESMLNRFWRDEGRDWQ